MAVAEEVDEAEIGVTLGVEELQQNLGIVLVEDGDGPVGSGGVAKALEGHGEPVRILKVLELDDARANGSALGDPVGVDSFVSAGENGKCGIVDKPRRGYMERVFCVRHGVVLQIVILQVGRVQWGW